MLEDECYTKLSSEEHGAFVSTKSEKRFGNKTNLTGEQRLQKEMSNPIKLHKRPSIKSHGMLRVTDDLLAISKQPLSGVPENRTHMQATIPHLPKINSAAVRENDIKESQVPISSIADYFIERKKTLKLNGFHWQRENISMPSSLPLVIRSYRSGNNDNVTYKEKCTGNRKGRKSCFLESNTQRKNLQNSAEGSTSINPDNTGLRASDGLSLHLCNGPLTTKFQKARTKVTPRFQGGHGYPVDGGSIISLKSVKSAKIANSSSDSVATMKWTKGFVRKPVNRQQRPSATSFAEKGNTRIELEQGCSPSSPNGISLDLEIEHRSVSQAANCSVHTGSDKLCFDDNSAHNVKNITEEKGADSDHAASKSTFQNPDVHNICPVIPKCANGEGKLNKIIKQPGRKLQRTKSSSSIATSLSKTSVKSYCSKTSEKTACCSASSKCSDKESKVSSSVSEDGRSEEYTFDLNQILQEGGESTLADVRVFLMKCGMRCHNQKQPLKSSLKKSFDWRAHSQTMTVHVPKTREQWKDTGVNQALDRSMKGCSQNKLVPLYQPMNQTAQDYVCSIPEESTEFSAKFCYDQKQYRKLRQLCHQPSYHYQNICNLGFPTAIQQRMRQLHYYGATYQGFARNMEMAANTKMYSDQFYWRENHTFQPEDESQHLQFPQPRDLIWCKNPSAERTVELFSSHGAEVPKITMTCPTPGPCKTPS